MRTYSIVLAGLLTLAARLAGAGPYTDLWWNPSENGWGMNLVQQGETAFVTLFVYGADGTPRWYVASDAQVVAYDASGLPVFGGALYRTEGSWHGSAFDPSRLRIQPVGWISIEARAKDSLHLVYEAEGVQVAKDVQRQTWSMPDPGGAYHGSFRLRQVVPGEASVGVSRYSGDIVLLVDGAVAFMRVDDTEGRRCEYRGAYRQSGKLGNIAGSFTCSRDAATVSSGSFELADLESTAHGITGYLRQESPALSEFGHFGAAAW